MSPPVALVRPVSASIAECELTHLARAPVDPARARSQHEQYVAALRAAGCHVVFLPAEDALPDAVFVEDTAVVLDEVAILTRPGAPSRRPETASVAVALRAYRPLEEIAAPATLDGGDVLRIGRRLHVGRTPRTNDAGIAALAELAGPHGYEVRAVEVRGCLHLKSAITQVGPGTVLLNPAWVNPDEFADYEQVEVHPAEPAAGNALLIGSALIHAAEHRRTSRALLERGYLVHPVPADELAKAEGGVTCCSLILGG